MPSSPGYVRDYKREDALKKKRGEQGVGHNSGNAIRNRARRVAIKLGMLKPGENKDVDHIKPLVKGGPATDPKNLRAVSEHANRSYPRTKNAGMK
jgi:hypothetical protein